MSSLSIGIVGLPNVGKSTLFNAILKKRAALAANYPFATIEPNVGIVDVPDLRLEDLARFVRNDYGNKIGDRELPEKIVPSVIQFYDIAGLVEGAHKGEGLGNAFLGHIRETDALVQVLRDFEDPNVIRAGAVTPEADRNVINTELILADMQFLEKSLQSMSKKARSGDKETQERVSLYEKVLEVLNRGELANTLPLTTEEKKLLSKSGLLSAKPMLYVYNIDESRLSNYSNQISSNNTAHNIYICAKIESELIDFSKEDRASFLSSLGVEYSGLDSLIRKSFELLGLTSFLTMGPKEVRSWTIPVGISAPQAAGKIHTDFEKAFIGAEVINFEDLVSLESWKKAKEVGKIRLEGKSYVMKDGDVVEFRVNP